MAVRFYNVHVRNVYKNISKHGCYALIHVYTNNCMYNSVPEQYIRLLRAMFTAYFYNYYTERKKMQI